MPARTGKEFLQGLKDDRQIWVGGERVRDVAAHPAFAGWPLLVLTDPNKQPLSVRLPTIQSQTELGVFLAAMFIACLVPVAGFLIFQRSFLRGSGLGGAIKG